ncbi:MAG TPA: HmuY family protein [Chitinophagales bacterium]|nr:HmuY family protein [Chitinophagales bacterium]
MIQVPNIYTAVKHRGPRHGLRTVAVWVLVLGIVLGFSSCFKEQNMLPPADQDYGQIAVIEMTPTYAEQFYFNLANNAVIKRTPRFSFDIMLDSRAGQYNIWLNSAKMMGVKRTGRTELDSVTLADTLGGDWHYDFGAFDPDSNAIGQWWNNGTLPQPVSAGQVYIVQLGVDVNGYGLGFVKMKVNNYSDGAYSITFSDFTNAPVTKIVNKDDTRNYKYLSFANGGQEIDAEPPKNEWDLCFTRYTVYFYAPYNIPYEVTGVLHNPSRVQAYMDSTLTFDSITIADFETNRLLTRRDAIGYEWKRYSSLNANGSYSMNPHYTYYIKVNEDEFYKLHFYSFEKDGVRGYPSFEYYRI